jgi:hypothetical protein
VECVTFQGPEIHLRVGGAMEGDVSVVGRVEGARRVTIVAGSGRGGRCCVAQGRVHAARELGAM